MLPESIKSLIKSQCQKILIVWNNVDANYLQKIADEIKSLGKVDLKLNFEHFPLLKLTNFRKSSFDMIITGFPIDFPSIDDSQNFFFDSIDYLRQNGSIFVYDKRENRAKIEKSMKLSGLIDIETGVDGNEEIDTIVYSARSPPFELGALSSLSLTMGDHEAAAPATVWRLDQDDLIDTDALLEPADLARPSTVAMDAGACGATAKRACKNCTCGLAEELAATEKEKTVTNEDDKPVRSACGNCYLGDGFRCSGCPYLGMPPFRPGERVLLVDSDDIDL